MNQPAVLVIGDVMTDVIVMPDGPMVRGSDRRAKIISRPGGSGANQAVWLARFGVDVRFVARVGVADLDTNSAYFRSLGVTPMLVGDAGTASGILVSIVDVDGERSFLTDRGANLNLNFDDLPFTLLDGIGLLLGSGYSYFSPGPRTAVMALMQDARNRKIPTAVDTASVGFLREVGASAFLKWTAGVDTIFANFDEAQELTGSVDLNLQMQTLGRSYPRVVIKRGAKGAAVGGRNGVTLALPAPRSDVIDTTGAGDAFAAAFVATELRGGKIDDCLKAGIEAGATAVTLVGGQPDRGLFVPTR
jgi:sugar/nucleoside kinase (ribokinase family)